MQLESSYSKETSSATTIVLLSERLMRYAMKQLALWGRSSSSGSRIRGNCASGEDDASQRPSFRRTTSFVKRSDRVAEVWPCAISSRLVTFLPIDAPSGTLSAVTGRIRERGEIFMDHQRAIIIGPISSSAFTHMSVSRNGKHFNAFHFLSHDLTSLFSPQKSCLAINFPVVFIIPTA
jgi:hypothetical protein